MCSRETNEVIHKCHGSLLYNTGAIIEKISNTEYFQVAVAVGLDENNNIVQYSARKKTNGDSSL